MSTYRTALLVVLAVFFIGTCFVVMFFPEVQKTLVNSSVISWAVGIPFCVSAIAMVVLFKNDCSTFGHKYKPRSMKGNKVTSYRCTKCKDMVYFDS